MQDRILEVWKQMLENVDRAIKHYLIAEGGGHKGSLDVIQQMYKSGRGLLQKMVMQKLYELDKHTLTPFEVIRGMKLLHLMRELQVLLIVKYMKKYIE